MDRGTLGDERRAFGGRIKAIRAGLSLTLAELAHSSDLSDTYLSNIEGGRENPTFQVIVALARALGVRPADLFRDVPDRAPAGYPPELARLASNLKDAPPAAKRAAIQAVRAIVGSYKIPRRRKGAA